MPLPHITSASHTRPSKKHGFIALLIIMLCSAALSPAAFAAKSFYDDLKVNHLDDTSADLNQYKGRLVLVNFWATWCPPCVEEMPSLQRLQQQFDPEKFQVIAINLGQSSATVEQFFAQQAFDFDLPVYLDSKGQGFSQLKIAGMPSSFLISADGELIEKIVGAREWDHPANLKAVHEMIQE
ncbi:TlpA disulfide reductase family protein [Amphritea sp. 2_MG-2023]|uniref:TlpA disulfide reductase family protein n=1 Tax=Amphritea TaxID=515417 RepID=UPI001C0699E1|nr:MULTISPECIES: TlpA disulfide reductase family protein [Amphritea]MBU2966692.1 TlpA family protein disulfide reductase [Amphritea atlantica]MDO6417449.1 TlpA disulfide reductase family protein [Amphritea sp. 2_MG-2023]MDX2421979.1 TlpA disulfide reductase family protein [Amphritea sp.]